MAKMPDLRPDERLTQKMSNHIFNSDRGMYPGIMAGVVENPFYIKAFHNKDLFSKLNYGHCNNLELDYYRCASRVGLVNVQRGNDCLMEFEDLHECIGSRKAHKRALAMKKEARKQGKPYLEEPVQFTTIRMNNDGANTTIV